jgi:RNA polymerase sigma-70 factor (ECF subfamily)
LSLLDRLTGPTHAAAWDRLVRLYAPLLHQWLVRQVQPADADDLVQDILSVLLAKLPSFQHNGRPGAFRAWLRTILVYRLRDFWRQQRYRPIAGDAAGQELLDRLENADDPLSQQWDREHDRHLMAGLLDLIRSEFAASTWSAFYRSTIDGVPLADVADELGLTHNAVCLARSRVLRRLREEARGLLTSAG